MTDPVRRNDTGVLEKKEQKEKAADLWNVVLHNDDYTTMEFVVEILEEIFGRSPAEAFRIMMNVHREGRGIAGSYPFEIAETKAESVIETAQVAGFPLRASVEEA
jgi:ATP-dependent Clp protease adaptor protein ClpS